MYFSVFISMTITHPFNVHDYVLRKNKKNKLKTFNKINKPHKKKVAFKSRLRWNKSSSIIEAFWTGGGGAGGSFSSVFASKILSFVLRTDWSLIFRNI